MTFRFTIADLATFLGKSPVTIRGWERKGLLPPMPRLGANRTLNAEDIYEIAEIAYKEGRISDERRDLIRNAVMDLRFIEMENE